MRSVFSGIALIGLMAMLTGCGGGGGSSQAATLTGGTWRQARVAIDGSGDVACPGTIALSGGGEISCGANDTVVFSGNTYESIERDEDGTMFRERGTFFVSGNTITSTATETAQDTNNNGVFEGDEITPVSEEPIVQTILELSETRFRFRGTFGTLAGESTYNRGEV
jgi:hypothetical protein